jgi:MFS transporter, DHA1 family, tetracycline resistance protein
MNNRYLSSIILIVFIDLLGFSLIIPLLPYYAQTFNASDTTIGFLLTSYAAAQLIGAPILGRARGWSCHTDIIFDPAFDRSR